MGGGFRERYGRMIGSEDFVRGVFCLSGLLKKGKYPLSYLVLGGKGADIKERRFNQVYGRGKENGERMDTR